MTTFTLQDLNTATPEEDEAFEALAQALENRKIFDNIQPATKEDFMNRALQQHEQNHAIIQGATGAQYTPIDTKQYEGVAVQPTVQQLAQQLTQSFTTLINAILELQPQPVSEGLNQACSTVLENAEWFNKMVNDSMVDAVEGHDFSSDIETAVGSEVEQYFNYNFNLEDHCDVYDLMRDAVDDKLEDMVQKKLEKILNERLSTATITFS